MTPLVANTLVLPLNQMGEAFSHETLCCNLQASDFCVLFSFAYRASSSVNARCDDIQAKMFAFPSASVADLRFHLHRALLTVNELVTFVVI